MPTKASLIISIIVALALAGFAFVTKGKIEEKNSMLHESKQRADSLQGDLTKTKTTLQKTQTDLTAANKTVNDQKTQLDAATTAASAAKSDAEKAQAALADSEKKLADANAELDKYKNPTASTEKPQVVLDLEKQVQDKQREVEEQKIIVDNLRKQTKQQEDQLAGANTQLKRYTDNITKAGLTGRIVAVNPGWNFVVLDVGDRQGVAVNSQLYAMRGGQTIARLKVTSVEPRTSIADVVAGSMPKGANVQAGDRVVFAAYRGQAPTSNPAGPSDVLPPAPPAGAAGAPPLPSANPPATAPQANAQ